MQVPPRVKAWRFPEDRHVQLPRLWHVEHQRRMYMSNHIERYFSRLTSTLRSIHDVEIETASDAIWDCRSRGQRLYTCGNGGSAATASHFVNDLTKLASPVGRSMPIRALCLTDNVPSNSAWANDTFFEAALAEQLVRWGEEEDLLVAFSCSGNSPNILRVLEASRDLGMYSIAIVGTRESQATQLATRVIVSEETHFGVIEDCHLAIAHVLADEQLRRCRS